MAAKQAYMESLPKKRMAAGCLFFDAQQRILLVKPTYKPGWGIPGGVVELNESPKQACRREVCEEIGLERSIGELLVVDYNSPTDAMTESLMFIFNGGALTASEIASIHLRREEISEFGFFSAAALPVDMTQWLRNRILAALQQVSSGKGVYLENQASV